MSEIISESYTLPAGLGDAKISVSESLSSRLNAITSAKSAISSGSPLGIASAAFTAFSIIPGLAPLGIVGGLVGSFLGGNGPTIEEVTLEAVQAVGQEVQRQSAIIQSVIESESNKTRDMITNYYLADSEIKNIIYQKFDDVDNSYKAEYQNIYNNYLTEKNNLISEQEKLRGIIQSQNENLKYVYQNAVEKSLQLLTDRMSKEMELLIISYNSDVEKLREIEIIEKEIIEISNLDVSAIAEKFILSISGLLNNKGWVRRDL